MKAFIIMIITLTSLSATAYDCTDPNLRNMQGVEDYRDLTRLERFDVIADVWSAAPAGFEDVFGSKDELCRTVRATYLKHKSTGTNYVIYTTHDDYCDGGNTMGIMLNMKKYMDEDSDLSNSIVGTIGDSWFGCY